MAKGLHKAAALEPNKTRLVDKIHTAEATLMTRLSELTDRKEDETELNALEKAIKAIRTIKKKRLGFE